MELFGIIYIIIIFIASVIFYYIRVTKRIKEGPRNQIIRVLKEIETKLKMKYLIDSENNPYLKKEFNSYPVSILGDGKNGKYIRITIKYKHNSKYSFLITDRKKQSENKLSYINVQTGEKSFDNNVVCYGEKSYVIYSLLTKEVREKLKNLSYKYNSFSLTKQEFIIIVPYNNYYLFGNSSHKKYIEQLNMALEICNVIIQNKCSIRQLKYNIKTEVDEIVKLNTINELGEAFSIKPGVKSFLFELLNDKSVKVKIASAKHLGDEGLKHLNNLLKTKKHLHVTYKITIIELFKNSNYKESVEILKEIYKKTKSYKLKISILSTTSHFKDESLNDILVSELKARKNRQIWPDIIKALENCGNRKTISPLDKMWKDKKYFEVKGLIEKSLITIRSRYEHERGMLSVQELSESDGALSIEDSAEKGSLTLEDEE